jgi:hypothetical protein
MNSIEQWPTDVNNHSVRQEIHCIFWCPNNDNVYISQPEWIQSTDANPTPLIYIVIFFFQSLPSQLPSGCIAWEFQTNSSYEFHIYAAFPALLFVYLLCEWYPTRDYIIPHYVFFTVSNHKHKICRNYVLKDGKVLQ